MCVIPQASLSPLYDVRPLENIIHVISLKTNEARITCDTKTKDNVFVQVRVSVMYKVSGQNVHNAYYKVLFNNYI